MTRSTKEFKKAKKSAERAIDQTRKAAQHGVEAGRAKFEETGARLEEASEKVGREAAGQVRAIREGAHDGYERVIDAVESGYGGVRDSLDEMRGEIGSYTRKNIVGTVLVASAIGFCLGLLLGRR